MSLLLNTERVSSSSLDCIKESFDKLKFFYLIKIKIKHFISSKSNIWYENTAQRTNRKVMWCNGYHFCLTRRGLQFKHQGTFWQNEDFYLIKIKIEHFISSQCNIWYENTAQRTNRKVMWCNGYHFCLTRRGLQFKTGQHRGKFFTKWCFYLIKFKIMHFISGQSNIWYEITAAKHYAEGAVV